MAAFESIRLKGAVGGNVVAIEDASRNTVKGLGRRVAVMAVLALLAIAACMCLPTNIFVGELGTEMTPQHFIALTMDSFGHLVGILTGTESGVFQVQFCTYIVAAVAGGALGMCGSVYQGALRNPLAAPKTLGVMSGGALGAFIWILFLKDLGPQIPWSGSISTEKILEFQSTLTPVEWFWSNYGKALCSMVGCFIIVGAVISIASLVGRGKLSNITMIISGQIFATGITALILFARYHFISTGNDDLAEEMAAIENYVLTSGYFFYDLAIICIPILLCMAVVFLMRNRLTMLSLGDAEAQSMGINVNRTRYGMVAICTFMTALAISFCGHVAFLGFISAHTARKAVGPDMRYLLPASVCTGVIYIVVVHYLTTAGLPFASPGSEGMLISIIGATVFLLMAVRTRGGSGDWR